MENVNRSVSFTFQKKSGYDLPLYGIDNGQFLYIHIPALVCIFLSLISVAVILILSFNHQNILTFFLWKKSERFVVYLAICDGLFNICHSMDHVHMLITRSHVYPKSLCTFYGFMLAEFITAQNLLVNVISINAFVLIYFRKKLDFGKYDWKLLMWIFGMPFAGGMVAMGLDKFGPTGAFCFFDGVKGGLANFIFISVPLLLILFLNAILYVLTWYHIKKKEPRFKDQKGNEANIIRASCRAARRMTLFVVAFVIQWWAIALYTLWVMFANHTPQLIHHFGTTFTNIGGVLNVIVYFIIRKERQRNSVYNQ